MEVKDIKNKIKRYQESKKDKLAKVHSKLLELKEIEEEFYEEHEELDYSIEIEEIERATQHVKMSEINKQIDVIAKYYKKMKEEKK